MKKLSVGIQRFSEFKDNDLIYVDKTEIIHKLIDSGKYYFLSRPRRFGKSLLLDTIKELFSGNKALFEDLWIYDKWNFEEKHPVINLSFTKLEYAKIGLGQALENFLDKEAQKNKIVYDAKTYSGKILELIEKLGQEKPVVILIDEYDKPIIDYLEKDTIAQAQENRKILRQFYQGIKDLDGYIKFFLMTGVSKFSKVSIFSELNHLEDITIDDNYSNITGYTKSELESYYADYLNAIAVKLKQSKNELLERIKDWYNGYSWDGVHFLYNPFSMLNFLKKGQFINYWFATGTPFFLLEQIKDNHLYYAEIDNLKKISLEAFESYEIEDLDPIALMFQTGYLTIKEYHMDNQTYVLDYPNKEVRDSFLLYALKSYTSAKKSLSNKAVNNLIFYIESNHIEKFILELKALFSSIPVQEVKQIYQYEAYYHSVIYVALRLMGCSIDCEVQSNHGITDAVIKTEENIYIIEFKMGRAKEALKQIKEKKYYFPYLSDKRKKHLFGIGFDKGERNIGDWEIEIIGERMEEMNKVVSFESEKLILVDEDDTVVGYETKDKCHNGDGILHRAFSIFIFNSEGKLLLQKRAATKRLWGQFWSNTCCSHPRKGEDYDIATVRRLEEELGMKTKLKYLYKFQYQAAFKNLGSENELCSVYIGKSDDAPKVNSTEIEEIQYIFAEELDVELEKNPNQFTPWFKMEWKTLRENYWKKIEGLVI